MNTTPVLSQAEANRLLNMLKTTLQSEVVFPEKGKAVEFKVQGDTKKDNFTIKIYRGKINHNKHEIGARITKEGTLLLELHISPNKPHINPDGTKIIGSHWHIYSEEYYRRQAYPATDVISDNFVDTTMKFFEKFHVISTPTINYQLEILP